MVLSAPPAAQLRLLTTLPLKVPRRKLMYSMRCSGVKLVEPSSALPNTVLAYIWAVRNSATLCVPKSTLMLPGCGLLRKRFSCAAFSSVTKPLAACTGMR